MLVGGGIPFFPRHGRRVDLDLVETRAFGSKVVYLRHRVARRGALLADVDVRGRPGS